MLTEKEQGHLLNCVDYLLFEKMVKEGDSYKTNCVCEWKTESLNSGLVAWRIFSHAMTCERLNEEMTKLEYSDDELTFM